MEMTHYMELLATNQPWNLILYMAIPVILAETIAISEIYLLYTQKKDGAVHSLSKISGILAGWYFLGVFIYLMYTAVIPLTHTGAWRGAADVIAVGFYLLGVVPLFGMALLDMNWLKPTMPKQKLHAIFVGMFLVVAHIAMIFGMLNPSIFSHESKQVPASMSGMDMSTHSM